MSLDIYFTERANETCPHCGGLVKRRNVQTAYSSGSPWYDILEELGYYVPHDKRNKRTGGNDWYGKDMELTEEQAKAVFKFAKEAKDLDNRFEVQGLVATALLNGSTVVINADW